MNKDLKDKLILTTKKCFIKLISSLLLANSVLLLSSCAKKSDSDMGSAGKTIETTKPQADITITPMATASPSATPALAPEIKTGSVLEELVRDLDGNGTDDSLQIVSLDDEGIMNSLHVYFNGEKIYEHSIEDLRFMGLFSFEYLDLDEDNTNEIFITADTNTNSRPYTELLCLKETDGVWNRMILPQNEHGLNGFPFKITRGNDEFEFVVSSDYISESVHFDASAYFRDDESGNIDTIQNYRSNNYKAGDEVGFISAWDIHEARTGSYNGRNCIIANHGIEGPYGHSLGKIDIYFAYNPQGDVEILHVEHLK